MKNIIRNSAYFLIFTILIMLVAVAFLRDNWFFFFLTLFTLLAVSFLRFFFKWSHITYPDGLEMLLILFLGSSFLIDDLLLKASSLNGLFIINAFSAMLFASFAFMLVFGLNRFHRTSPALRPSFVVLFALSFSLAINFLWLFAEHLFVYFFNSAEMQSGPVELIYSVTGMISGVTIISIAGYYHLKYRKQTFIGSLLDRFFVINARQKTYLQSVKNDSLQIIEEGESEGVEFKETLRYNIRTGFNDKKIEHAVLKTLCAFLNTAGGVLFIGVNDAQKIVGLDRDGFDSLDKLQLHLANIVAQNLSNGIEHFIEMRVISSPSDKKFLRVDCVACSFPVFLTHAGSEEFFVRFGSASQQLTGSALLKYITTHFSEREIGRL